MEQAINGTKVRLLTDDGDPDRVLVRVEPVIGVTQTEHPLCGWVRRSNLTMAP